MSHIQICSICEDTWTSESQRREDVCDDCSQERGETMDMEEALAEMD